MKKNKKEQVIFMSFPFKVSILFSLGTLIVSIGILSYFYFFTKKNILNSLQNRIKDIGKTGIYLFKEKDLEYLKKLDQDLNEKFIKMVKENPEFINEIKKTPEGETYDILSKEEHEEMYSTKEAQSIVQNIRKIKAGSSPEIYLQEYFPQKFYQDNTKPFLRYTYLLTSVPYFDDYQFVKFLFDSDMEVLDLNQNGKIDPDEKGATIGCLWNVMSLPMLQYAFKTKVSTCENDLYEDRWGRWLSCYIPIFDYKKNFIGIMALDLDVGSEYDKLEMLKKQAYLLLILLVLGTFFVSYVSAKIFLKPIIRLSDASIQVANKDFNISLSVPSRDEVGILTHNFNLMVKEIKEYSEHLEELVKQRTKELQEALINVQNLKNKQDGDYFLTSLLIEPLIKNWNKSKFVTTEVLIKQKKEFVFKDKKREIGGDICITGNLRFLNKNKKIERCIFFFNGDAMGKSLQGAGGSLVAGVVINALLSRSAAKDKIQSIPPVQWFKEMAYELQYLFTKFDGSMMVTAATGIINEHTGELIYANFEHPRTILYRNHKATFLEEEGSMNYKFGFPETGSLKVVRTFLQEGDILILGSDGRDDIILKDTGELNRDEALILTIVEESLGRIETIYETLQRIGEFTDDFSLLKVEFLKKLALIENDSEELKDLIRKKLYDKIIEYANNTDFIEDPFYYYYISIAHYKKGNLKEAIKWFEPIKELIQHPSVEKYKKHLYEVK